MNFSLFLFFAKGVAITGEALKDKTINQLIKQRFNQAKSACQLFEKTLRSMMEAGERDMEDEINERIYEVVWNYYTLEGEEHALFERCLNEAIQKFNDGKTISTPEF
jgi:hypothetical protein